MDPAKLPTWMRVTLVAGIIILIWAPETKDKPLPED